MKLRAAAAGGGGRSSATLERILQCAETEFAECGYAAGRIAEISKRAGITKQLVYHYFESKEDLYQTVLERITDRYDDMFDMRQYDCLSPVDAVRLFVCRHFRLHAGNGGNLLRDLAMHGADGLHLSRRRGKLVQSVSVCLETILARGREEGVFNDRFNACELLLMINIITNGAVATGPVLISIMAPDLPSCPKQKTLEALCASFIIRALKG